MRSAGRNRGRGQRIDSGRPAPGCSWSLDLGGRVFQLDRRIRHGQPRRVGNQPEKLGLRGLSKQTPACRRTKLQQDDPDSHSTRHVVVFKCLGMFSETHGTISQPAGGEQLRQAPAEAISKGSAGFSVALARGTRTEPPACRSQPEIRSPAGSLKFGWAMSLPVWERTRSRA